MSKGFWADRLNLMVTKLGRFLEATQPDRERGFLRIAVIGIGQEMRGDDGIGLEVARRLRPNVSENLLIIEGGHAPENHTGTLRHFKPDLVLMIDAAELGEQPGSIHWLPWQETAGLSASTHTMPLHMLAAFITAELGCEVAVIGIQPARLDLGASISPAVQNAGDEVVEQIGLLVGKPQGQPLSHTVSY